jgi:hypothetical protein
MIEIVILVLSPIVGVLVFCFTRTILVEGMKDDVAFPLENCDTSMVEECLGDETKHETYCSK